MVQERQVNLIRKTPLVLQAIFLEILRGHFSKNSEQFLYSPDIRETRVIIEPAFKWDAEQVQVRPAIYVKRGAFQYNRIAIDDVQSKDLTTGEYNYTMLANALVTCMCISKASGEAERLAEEVSEVLIAFKSLIRRDFGFKKFDVSSINELGILEESQEFYAVPVMTMTQFEESWCLFAQGLKLQEIIVNIHTKINDGVEDIIYGEGGYGLGPYDGGPTTKITTEPGVKTEEELTENLCCPDDPPGSGY